MNTPSTPIHTTHRQQRLIRIDTTIFFNFFWSTIVLYLSWLGREKYCDCWKSRAFEVAETLKR